MVESRRRGPSEKRGEGERNELVSIRSTSSAPHETHRPDKVAQKEASSRPSPRRSPLGALVQLLAEREVEDVQGDGYPDKGYHVPGGAGKHFEVGGAEETSGVGEVTVRRGASAEERRGREKKSGRAREGA